MDDILDQKWEYNTFFKMETFPLGTGACDTNMRVFVRETEGVWHESKQMIQFSWSQELGLFHCYANDTPCDHLDRIARDDVVLAVS